MVFLLGGEYRFRSSAGLDLQAEMGCTGGAESYRGEIKGLNTESQGIMG
jgi:hypothetical protein